MNNLDQFNDAFADALMVDKSQIVDELKYQSLPEWDSITHMILITNLEAIFNINLATDEVIAMESVAKAKEILVKHGVDFGV